MEEAEIKPNEKMVEQTTIEQTTKNKAQETPETSNVAGNRPVFNVVQPDHDQNGKTIFVNVGAMWKNISKNGNEFYTLRIGEMKLLVFPNDRK